jgi:hypothetical protein
MIMRNRASLAACVSALVAGIVAAVVAAQAGAADKPSLTGMWLVEKPQAELKTVDGKTPPLKPEAAKLYAESAQIERTLGDRWGAVESLCGLAGVVGAMGRHEQAACIWGAAERLREEIFAPMGPTERAAYERRVAEARTFGDAATWQASWQAGRNMDWDDAIGFALAGADRAAT